VLNPTRPVVPPGGSTFLQTNRPDQPGMLRARHATVSFRSFVLDHFFQLRISRNKVQDGLLLRDLASAGNSGYPTPNGAGLMDFISFPAARRDCRDERKLHCDLRAGNVRAMILGSRSRPWIRASVSRIGATGQRHCELQHTEFVL
jgi:hypothetical protein